ncbi:AAA family ATPase [Xylophilus sp. GW821-FHT01B05]
MPRSSPPLLLSLRGRASLHAGAAACLLPCRYRKGLAVLGYLAAQPNRVFPRERLAALLWPDLETTAGRANLRVVLSDLVGALRKRGLEEALDVQRETLAWRPGTRVLLDLDWLASAGVQETGPFDRAFLAREALQGAWLPGAGEGCSEEFVAWLACQRTQADAALQRAMRASRGEAPVVAAADPAGHALQPSSPPPVVYAALALLRVELAEVSAGDKQACAPGMAPFLDALRTEAAFFDGLLLEADDVGCTFGFGVHGHHTGQRWQALRCAAALAALPMMRSGQLRAGITFGRVLLAREGGLRVAGWRTRLVERLAQRAGPGEIACDESLADLAAYIGCRADGVRRIRGLSRDFSVFRRFLPAPQELWRMLPPPGDFPDAHFGRDALVAAVLQDFSRIAGAACCLVGEAGTGKTRTAWECAQRLRQQGRRVFWLAGRPEGRAVPWRGLQDLARALVGASPANLVIAPAAWQALCDFASTGKPPLEGRATLVDALGLLLSGSGRAPALVVIDDAHWLDEASAGFLLEAAPAWAATWLLTCPSGQSQPLALPRLRTAALLPLDDHAARAVLDSLPGTAALTPAQRRGRIASARGIPLYLLADAVVQSQGSHFSEFCGALFAGLEQAQPAMLAAAALGMLFSMEDLASLCGRERAQQAVARATAAGLIVARGPEHAAFFHARLRCRLLDAAPRDALVSYATEAAALRARQQLHAQAAALLELAGEPQLACRAWLDAAQQALEQDDVDAASSHCAQMARLGLPNGADGMRARRLQAQCQQRSAEYAQAEDCPLTK